VVFRSLQPDDRARGEPRVVKADAQEVEAEFRGVFSSMESAFQNIFELLSYTSTMIFFRPEDFQYPVMISLSMVFASNFCYTIYVRKRRGHLLHPEKLCGCGKREDRSDYIPLTEGPGGQASPLLP
jgi:iron-regulated transporter 1